MAASFSSSDRLVYDVFVSFRGEDTLRSFVCFLDGALKQKAIYSFIDYEYLHKGNKISELLKAIEDSRLSIVVLSENYAYSSWCLNELVKILECMDTNNQIVLPIFYQVDPSHIRNLNEKFGEAFANKFGGADKQDLESWRSALTRVADLSGWDSNKYKNDIKLIGVIVEDVFRKLFRIPSSTAEHHKMLKGAKEIACVGLEKNAEHAVQVVDEEYQALPEHLKWLFLYCSLFPSGYEFTQVDLVQLWIAEDFIREKKMETLEDIAIKYFNSLVSRSFFVFSRHDRSVDFGCLLNERDLVSLVPDYNGKNSLYKVNATKLSILENVSGNYCFTVVDGKLDGASEMTQHLSFAIKCVDEMSFGALERFKHLRTLLLLSGCGSSIKQVPRSLFLRLKFLRTLNLSKTSISELPSSIGNVKSLCYLDVSHTPITQFPESFDSLCNLQTLKLRGCTHFVKLPKGMQKLISLRHIDLDIIQQLNSMPAHLGKLSNLQTLSAFLVGRDDGCRIEELKNLNHLKGELCISRLENVLSRHEAEEVDLIKKCLHKLELRWSNMRVEKIGDEDEVLDCLRPHSGLMELRILFYGGSKLPTWMNNPSFADLVSITLYRCTNCKLLPSLGELPALRFLYIKEMNEVQEISNQFFRNGSLEGCHAFRKLERLAVDVMLNLQLWIGVPTGDLPSLLKLTVHSCPKLVTLPSIACLKSLKHLEISSCPKIEFLPSDGLPTSLESVIIVDCPKLKERCSKGKGEDWDKIPHASRVWFDHQEVTKDDQTC